MHKNSQKNRDLDFDYDLKIQKKLSKYMFTQKLHQASAAIHELSLSQKKNASP